MLWKIKILRIWKFFERSNIYIVVRHVSSYSILEENELK